MKKMTKSIIQNLAFVAFAWLAVNGVGTADPVVIHPENCMSADPLAPINSIGGSIACFGADAGMSGRTRSAINEQMQVNSPGREAQSNLVAYLGAFSNQFGGANVTLEKWNITEGVGTFGWADKTINSCGGEGNSCVSGEDFVYIEPPVNPANPSQADGRVVHLALRDKTKPAQTAGAGYTATNDKGATAQVAFRMARGFAPNALEANGGKIVFDRPLDVIYADEKGLHIYLASKDGKRSEQVSLIPRPD